MTENVATSASYVQDKVVDFNNDIEVINKELEYIKENIISSIQDCWQNDQAEIAIRRINKFVQGCTLYNEWIQKFVSTWYANTMQLEQIDENGMMGGFDSQMGNIPGESPMGGNHDQARNDGIANLSDLPGDMPPNNQPGMGMPEGDRPLPPGANDISFDLGQNNISNPDSNQTMSIWPKNFGPSQNPDAFASPDMAFGSMPGAQAGDIPPHESMPGPMPRGPMPGGER